MEKRKLRIFLDSNVVLSGLLSNTGAPRIILDILTLHIPTLQAVIGKYNLIEIERNLSKKLTPAIPIYQRYLPKLKLEEIPLPSPSELEQARKYISNKDAPVLASAIKGNIHFLVTGDKDFDPLKGLSEFSFEILSPREFLDIFASQMVKYLK